MPSPKRKKRTRKEVALAERPFTVPPVSGELISVTRAELMSMTDDELANFADIYLGIAFKPGWPRSKMIQNLVASAIRADDI